MTRPSTSCAIDCRSCASAALALRDSVPGAKTIWLFREQLARAGASVRLFGRFEAALAERGYQVGRDAALPPSLRYNY